VNVEIDSTPLQRFRQNCSSVEAPGKRPLIPMIAMSVKETELGSLVAMELFPEFI
jgi:hypothetical protein